MIWLTTTALAHELLPERIDDPHTWSVDAGWRVSLPEGDGGTRVAALVDVVGELPTMEARGRSGDEVGPWLALDDTFQLDTQYVLVRDLDRAWETAEIRVADNSAPLTVRWELLVPRFPDAGRIARQGPPASPLPLPPELGIIGVVGRDAWGARPTGCSAGEDDWYRMAVHHTAGAPTASGTVMGAVQVLQAYAQDSGEYCDTPYQFLVGYDGTLWEGRSLAFTSGATGGNNDGNIAVCFLGCYHPNSCPNGAGDLASDAMIDGGQLLVQTLTELHGIVSDADTIRGHQEWPYNYTACPGDYVLERLDELRTDLAWFAGEEVARSHPVGVPIALEAGQEVEVWIDVLNTGGLAWEPGVTQLGTTDPRDGVSALWHSSWLSENRPATVDVVVLPGEVGRFAFTVAGGAAGLTHGVFGLLDEGLTWFGDAPWGGGPGDDLLVIDVVVDGGPPTETTPTTTTTDGVITLVPGDDDGPQSEPQRIAMEPRGCGCATGGGSAVWMGMVLLVGVSRRNRAR